MLFFKQNILYMFVLKQVYDKLSGFDTEVIRSPTVLMTSA